MVKKGILEEAHKHFNDYILKELNDNNIRCWICGGILRDYFLNKKSETDCDLFFPNKEEFNKCRNYFEGQKYIITWESDNGVKYEKDGKTFDLIKKFFPSPEETIKNFDLTLSMIYCDVDKCYVSDVTFCALITKKIVINKLTNPVSTLMRIGRHSANGFTMSKSATLELVKLIKITPIEKMVIEEGDTSGDNIS